MKHFVIAAAALLTVACAATTPETPAAAPTPAQQTKSVATDLSIYEGTYALQAPARVLEVRVFRDENGNLNGELVGRGQQTVLRPDTTHKFLHATRDDVWFLFTVENGRATKLTMHQAGREISGPRQ
jgi:hypothetical protein